LNERGGGGFDMSRIEAIFQGGVFKPLGAVELPENQRVTLTVQPVEREDVTTWLTRVQELHRQFIAQHGYLPDSTPDIAEDRMRDV
jgi:predicted DNA-binding antitoxin AbrB/MazE fold protein